MAAPLTVDDVGVEGAIALLALVTAQRERRSVAPTRQRTLQALDMLSALGLIALPWPEERWAVEPRAEVTPIEMLQWRFDWPAYPRDAVQGALTEYLQHVACERESTDVQLKLWNDLLKAECEQYLEFHLGRLHLPTQWACDAVFVIERAGSDLSLAQWRYCFWAAARQGAAMAARRCYSEESLREGIYSEARRRAELIASGRWSTTGFDARSDEPLSAMSRVFARDFAKLGPAFFMVAPGLFAWRQVTRA